MSDIVKFIREKDYIFEKELGEGACGKTVLLRDDVINEKFVCKKYSPYYVETEEPMELFRRFTDEIKILHQVNHINVVRVFNYYLYGNLNSGYILMEFIDGESIDEYLEKNPGEINNIFEQVIKGFNYLSSKNILHRDIRSMNILVTKNGVVKIIDFGFSKKVLDVGDNDKSITLNWWCETPKEFLKGEYTGKTEIYFVGKLFESILMKKGNYNFKYASLLREMIEKDQESRIGSFSKILVKINEEEDDLEAEDDFDEDEIEVFREFSSGLLNAVSKISSKAKILANPEELLISLKTLYKKNQLNEYILDMPSVIRAFIDGEYYYQRNWQMEVYVLKNFLSLYKSSNARKKEIILENLRSNIDTLNKYTKPENDDVLF